MKNRIRELRKAKNMTMKQLGDILGVAESTISQYETEKRQPDTETLLRIAEFFGVTVGYLIYAETGKAPALTEKDERDVAVTVEQIMSNLAASGDLMFDGVPMSAEAKASMAAAMRIGLEEARRRNKETYTPKKFKKE